MFGILGTIFGRVLGSGILGTLGAQLTDALKAYEAAQGTEAMALAKQRVEEIQAMISAQHDATSIRKASMGFWEMRFTAFVIAIGPALHFLCVNLVSTFPAWFPGWVVLKLPSPMDTWEATVLLSFFGGLAGATTIMGLAAMWRLRKA